MQINIKDFHTRVTNAPFHLFSIDRLSPLACLNSDYYELFSYEPGTSVDIITGLRPGRRIIVPVPVKETVLLITEARPALGFITIPI
jgi:hypothetical protein